MKMVRFICLVSTNMSIVHHWSVKNVIKYLDAGGTVYRVLFQLESFDSENPSLFTILTPGSVDLDISTINPSDFTPFQDLTEEQVLEWVKINIVKYDIPNSDPIESKYEYEIYHERYLKNLKETITYTPDQPYSDVGYLTHPEPVEEESEETETDNPDDMAQIATEMGIPTPPDWT